LRETSYKLQVMRILGIAKPVYWFFVAAFSWQHRAVIKWQAGQQITGRPTATAAAASVCGLRRLELSDMNAELGVVYSLWQRRS